MKMFFSDGHGEEAPARFQDACDFREGFLPVRDMIEHVMGHHGVETGVVVGDGLGVDPLEGKLVPSGQVLAGSSDHAGGEVGERDVPPGRNPVGILLPQRSGAAAQFEERAVFGQVKLVEHPRMNPLRVRAKKGVEADAGVQVARIFVLVVEQVLRVLESHIVRWAQKKR